MADQAEDSLDSFQGSPDPVQSLDPSQDPVAAPVGGGLSSLGNIQSYDNKQMPISDTTRKYTPGAAIAMENSNAYYAKQFTQQKQEAVKKVAAAIQEGDYKKAAAIYSQIDPQGFQKILPHLEAIDPSLAKGLSYGKKKGELQAEGESHQLPTDIAAAKGEAKAQQTDAQKVEDPDGVVRIYNRNKMTGALTPTGQTAGYATKIKGNKNTGGYEAVSGSGKVSKPVGLSGNVVEKDSAGNDVTLQPGQQEKLNKEVDAFNKDDAVKDLSKQLHAYDVASNMVDVNPSGGMPLEILRMIRTVTTRPTQQEFMAMKGWKGQGLVTGINNAISEAKNGKMSPQTQKNMRNILDTVAEANVNEYNQLLNSRVSQIQGKTKVGDQTLDPKIIENRLNQVAPSTIQASYKQADQALEQIKTIPPGAERTKYFQTLSPAVQRIIRLRVKGKS